MWVYRVVHLHVCISHVCLSVMSDCVRVALQKAHTASRKAEPSTTRGARANSVEKKVETDTNSQEEAEKKRESEKCCEKM